MASIFLWGENYTQWISEQQRIKSKKEIIAHILQAHGHMNIVKEYVPTQYKIC